MDYTGTDDFQLSFDKGLKFYLDNFFLNDGTPKYYHNKTYPIDIHSPAQLIATLSTSDLMDEHEELANKVLNWTISNIQDEKGYFYYQLKKGISSNIPYMRWVQAWKFYTFTEYFKSLDT